MPSVLGLWGDSLDHLVHLLVAFVLALPIGWHRAREEQSAGLRTFPLVAIASCGLVQTAISVFGANATVNANIMQGVVTGIGFIGAGAIIRQGDFTRVTRPQPAFGQSASWVLRSAMAITTSESF
jgi:putative Mg2+ transporter-C (MgtC) family protein